MAGRRSRVSLNMIVRDEERNLAECLSPVAELFDEIVIVDTGSRDRTKQIARRFTKQVHDFQWCDDFSAARNECLRQSSGDWIYWLDADDRMRPQHLAGLRRLLETSLGDSRQVFVMDTLLPPVHGAVEPMLVTHVRLFPRGAGFRWKGRVHEQLQDLDKTPYRFVFPDIQIEHTGYFDAAILARKMNRNMRLLRMDYSVYPDDPGVLLKLGLAYSFTDRNAARRYLLQLVNTNSTRSSILRLAYGLLAEISLCQGLTEQAAELADRGLRLFPDDQRLMFARGAIYFLLADYAAATKALNEVIQRPAVRQIQVGMPAHIREKLAPRLLSSVLRLQEAYPQAEAMLLTILDRFPDDAVSWYDLGMLYLDQMRVEDFSPVVRRLMSLPRGQFQAGLLTSLWCLRHADPAPAGPIIERLITEDPRRSEPRMLRVEWLSRIGAPLEEQARALGDLLRIDPSNLEAKRCLAQIEQSRRPTLSSVVADSFAPLTINVGIALG